MAVIQSLLVLVLSLVMLFGLIFGWAFLTTVAFNRLHDTILGSSLTLLVTFSDAIFIVLWLNYILY